MHSIRSGFGLRVDDGPVLSAARLALVRSPRTGLAFADRWQPAPRRSGRVICSATLADAWPSGRALGMPWGVPMQIGNLTVATGPAGASPESAVLRVQVEEGLLICALAARGHPLPGSRPADVAGADILLLDGAGLRYPNATEPVTHPDAAVLAVIVNLASTGGGLILLDDPRLAAAVATSLPAASTLYAPAGLGRRIELLVGRPTRRPGKRLAPGGVLLWPRGRRLPAMPALATANRLHLMEPGAANATELEGAGPASWAWTRTTWSATADTRGLKSLIAMSGAKDVVVWHNVSEQVQRLESDDYRLWHLVPKAQLTLM